MIPWRRLPWKFVVRRLAKAHGFLDPIALMTRMHAFAQPSEVAEPLELLRAGAIFHARGLLNSRVIQHNRDWVWPFWVERQFDPHDDAFVPRAFTITHINLTHRNWTAIGVPDWPDMPIVDPRGLLTPFYDGWSIDLWLITGDGRILLPSRAPGASQALDVDGLAVTTETRDGALALIARAEVEEDGEGGAPVCRLSVDAHADADGWLVASLRPCNPEGVSTIHEAALAADRRSWLVEGKRRVVFSEPAARHHVSNYRAGDVHLHLLDLDDQQSGSCDVGMLTAAALFPVRGGEGRRLEVAVPLGAPADQHRRRRRPSWPEALEGHARLSVPDAAAQRLYDIAVRSLVLHSPHEVWPGPYTYKRFWFRDAAFIVHALLCAGLTGRAERALDLFPQRQTAFGFFHSQDGEWDSNGEALWIMERFCRLTGRPPKQAWRNAILKGGQWIQRKRLADDGRTAHSGLLPAGFSAEHLGPNDFYYWDDFWGIAGLRAAAWMAARLNESSAAEDFAGHAEDFAGAVERSLAQAAARLGRPAMPASPHRRLDAGAVGSLAAGYPLQLFAPDDPRLLDTVAWLREACFVDGGFFQDMIHSGINPYLTLHIAQVLLRAGDAAAPELMRRVGALASPTGQWPEAVHPRTLGGCMGDGQHVWAAAEWVLMLRNCLLREEGDGLVLGGGVPEDWLAAGRAVRFGPAPTAFGPVTLTIEADGDAARVRWQGAWHREAPAVTVRLPGRAPVAAAPGAREVVLERGAVS